jgi:hypothetical protein
MKYKKVEITEEKKKEIIKFFQTEHNNTTLIISKKFGYSIHMIGRIISEYYDLQKFNKK